MCYIYISMKPIVYTCIKRWRENNPIRYKEQCRRVMQKRILWASIANEFRKILIVDHVDGYVDGRGRPKSKKEGGGQNQKMLLRK